MFRYSLLIFSLLLIAVSIFNFGCKAKNPNQSGTLHLRLSGEPNLLNPILTTDTYSASVTGVIFSGLFRVNEKLELEPDLAESYAISNGGKTYTFKLRKGVKWHDGVPFTADDVVFTFETILNPKTNTVRRSNFMVNGEPIKFRAIDTYTVEATLPAPFAPFLVNAAIEIIPKHRLQGSDVNTTSFNRNPVGTGPFKFKQWKTGQHIIVTAYPEYYGPKAKLSQIVFKPIPDYNTALLAFKKGEIDELELSPKDVGQTQKMDHAQLFEMDQLLYSFVGFNLKNYHLRNPIVRQAVAHAVDRQAIVDAVLRGKGTVANIPSSPTSWAYPDPSWIPAYDYNPNQAVDLLKQAGYTKGKDGILSKNGKPLVLTLIYGQGGKSSPKAAEIIQSQLKRVGIVLEIRPMEWQSFIRVITAKTDPKSFDLCMLSWSLGIDPDSYSVWHSTEYPNGFNFGAYANPLVDRLLVEGRTETDPKKRAHIYHQAFAQIGKDLPYLFLYYPKTQVVVNNRVKGLAKPGPAGLFVRIESIWVTHP